MEECGFFPDLCAEGKNTFRDRRNGKHVKVRCFGKKHVFYSEVIHAAGR